MIGAGPAGALAARQLALRRFDVLLVEKCEFPRHKVCGCCINAAALAALRRAGLEIQRPRMGGGAWRTMQLAAGGARATIDLPPGVVLSRRQFDSMLVDAAVDAGVHFLPRTHATLTPTREGPRLLSLHGRTTTHTACTRLVLAADGLGGRSLSGAEGNVGHVRVAAESRIGAATIIEDADGFYRAGTIYMAGGVGGYVGLVRLEDNRLNVAAALDADHIAGAGGLAAAAARIIDQCRWPAVDGGAAATWKGTARLSRRRVRPAGRRLFVLGDAAGYVEPFTGEGIASSLWAALAVTGLASTAVTGWNAQLAVMWTRRHRRMFALRHAICTAVASLLRRPQGMAAVAGLLTRAPGLAAPIVRAMHAPSRAMEHHSLGK